MSVGKSRYQLRHEGQEIEVGAQFVVGREVDCELVLKGALVSRRHAKFTQCPEGLCVADMGSLNGVFVNQKRIAVCEHRRLPRRISARTPWRLLRPLRRPRRCSRPWERGRRPSHR